MILLAAAGLAFSQDAPEQTKQPAQPLEAEIIPVKTLTGDSFDRLVRLLDVFGARYKADNQLRTIVVYAPKDVVAQMRHLIEQLDRPGSEAAFGRNIEMTLTLLRCSTKAPASGSTLPPDMEAVAKQLRAATQYKDIQLWDVVPMRLQEGRDATEDLRLPGSLGQYAVSTAKIWIHPEAVYRKDQTRYVRFSRVDLGFRIPIATGAFTAGAASPNIQYSYQDVGLKTSGDFQEGQKTVLGKVSGMEEGDAIFAVVALKVLD
jgi:hypothetical protein